MGDDRPGFLQRLRQKVQATQAQTQEKLDQRKADLRDSVTTLQTAARTAPPHASRVDPLVERAREHLEPGETVHHALVGLVESKIMGQDTVRKGVLLATSTRVLAYAKRLAGHDLEAIAYSRVTSVEAGKTLTGPHVTVHASGNKIRATGIRTGDVRAFVAHVQERASAPTAPATAPAVAAPDKAAQLRELDALRTEGLVTDDEYAAKRKQILGL